MAITALHLVRTEKSDLPRPVFVEIRAPKGTFRIVRCSHQGIPEAGVTDVHGPDGRDAVMGDAIVTLAKMTPSLYPEGFYRVYDDRGKWTGVEKFLRK